MVHGFPRRALGLLLLCAVPLFADGERPADQEILPSAAELRELEATFAARVDELVVTLHGDDALDRQNAVVELGRIGLPAHKRLATLVTDGRWDVRQAVAVALARIGLSPVAPTLLALLKDANWAVRESAADGLARFHDDASHAALVAALDDAVWRVKVAALNALAARTETSVLPRILDLSQSKDDDIRFAALDALLLFDHPDAVARLAPLIADPDPELRWIGFLSVREARTQGDPARVLPLLDDPVPRLRIAALKLAVVRLGVELPPVAKAIDALLAGLGAEKDEDRLNALATVEELAPRLHPQLRAAVRHPNARVRGEAMKLIGREHMVEAVPEILEAYFTAPAEVRGEILGVVIELDPARAEFFAKVAREGGLNERLAAIRALGLAPQKLEASRAVLIDLLQDPAKEIRKASAEALFAVSADLAPAAVLERARAEQDPSVLSSLLNLVVDAHDDKISRELIDLYRSRPDGNIRGDLASAIGRRRDAEAARWVRERLADPDPAIRTVVLGATRDRPADFLDDLVKVASSDPSTSNRATAIAILGGTRDPKIFDLLVKCARSPDADVRSQSIRALAAQHDARALPVLIEATAQGEDILRMEAMDALMPFDDPKVSADLIAIATTDASELARSHATMLLSRWRRPEVIAALIPRAEAETSSFVKRQLAYTLGMLGDPSAIAAVTHLSEDEDAGVRSIAAMALGLFPPPLPLEPIRKLNRDPDPAVRLAVVETLAALAAAESRAILFERLLDPDRGVRRRAMRAVGAFREPAATQAALEAALKDEEVARYEGELRFYAAGAFLQKNGLEDAAHRAFETVLTTPPDDSALDAAAKYYLGWIDLQHGRFPPAVTNLEAAVAKYPAIADRLNTSLERMKAWAAMARGLAALADRKQTRAEREFAEVEAEAQGDPEMLNSLAWIMIENDLAPGLALEYGKKALQSLPDEPSIQDTVGWIQYKMGNQREALALLEAACKSRPEDAEILFHRSRVLMSNGHREEAFDCLGRAVMREPGLGAQAVDAAEFRAVRTNDDFKKITRPGPKFSVPE